MDSSKTNRFANGNLPSGETMLATAHKAWLAAANLRQRRTRNKRFTYGSQLDDPVMADDGSITTEGEALRQAGKQPLTNNLIRQLVKSVVGRFRRDIAQSDRAWPSAEAKRLHQVNMLDELDARLLEEFLISGCCIQKIEPQRILNTVDLRVSNVSVNRFFSNAFSDPRAFDCTLIGEIHDMTIAEIIMRLCGADRSRAHWIRNIYSAENAAQRVNDISSRIGIAADDNLSFFYPRNGKCRIYEIWTLETREVLRCHDRSTARIFFLPTDTCQKSLRGIDVNWDIMQLWHCRWITPMGDVVAEYDSPFAHAEQPYIVKFYPLTDGEVHSFVEDVIDQQKYVNRLISLVDNIMNSSAKGVLLYPADALPPGFSWQDIARLWHRPNAVIPFDSTLQRMPQQVVNNGSDVGAYQLLSLEMKLFDEISGVSGALQGREVSASTGSALYERQTENAIIALADIFDTFRSFRSSRNEKLLHV